MVMQEAEAQVDKIEILTNIGVVLAGIFAGFFAYATKKPPSAVSDPVIAGVGLELGNRAQTDQLISEVRRCADSLAVLADRKTEEIDESLKEILERLDREERDRRRG